MAFASSLFHAFLRRGITFDTEANLFKAPVDEHLLSDFSVLDVLGKAGQLARHDGIQALTFFLTERRKVLVPVNYVFVVENN